MTSRDVALLEDPIYLSYVQLFASSMLEFNEAFASAWWVKSFWWRWHCWWRLTQPRYKLTTRDMGPHSRCIGPIVPPPQPWQVGHDKTMMMTMMTTVQCIFLSSTHFPSLQISWLTLLRRNSGLVQRKKKKPKPVSICSWRWQCGETMTFVDCWVDSHGDARPLSGGFFSGIWDFCNFEHLPDLYVFLFELSNIKHICRSTDYQGGCNGARIRLSPQKVFTSSQKMSISHFFGKHNTMQGSWEVPKKINPVIFRTKYEQHASRCHPPKTKSLPFLSENKNT